MEDAQIIEGYEVKSAIRIGDKRFIFAVHFNASEPYPYMKCTAVSGSIATRYENAIASNDCLEALKLYADDIRNEALALEKRRDTCELEDTSCLHPADLIQVGWEDNIAGKIVAVREESLPLAYRDITHQLFWVEGGFGVEAKSRGQACYGWDLYDGKPIRIERPDVSGIVPDEKVPAFAMKTLCTLQSERTERKGRGHER